MVVQFFEEKKGYENRQSKFFLKKKSFIVCLLQLKCIAISLLKNINKYK